ncbi:hypothetical protein BGZ67_010177, partial [Mortierella alpina]
MLLQEHPAQEQQHLHGDHLMQPAEQTQARSFDLSDHDEAADPICRSSLERDSASASSGELRHAEPDHPTDLPQVSASTTIPTLDEL